MANNNILPAETPGASLDGTLIIEQFLMDNYRFRRNILNGKVEFAILPKTTDAVDGNTADNVGSLSCDFNEAELDYRPLTQAALNSIIIRAKREQVLEKGSPKTEITEYVTSEGCQSTILCRSSSRACPNGTARTILPRLSDVSQASPLSS